MTMADTTSPGGGGPLAGAALMRKNKLIYFALDLALILPRVVRQFTPLGAGLSALILAAAFFVTVVRSHPSAPAAAGLPVLLFCDVLVLLVLSYPSLVYDLSRFTQMWSGIWLVFPLWLPLAGAALSLAPIPEPFTLWAKGLGWAGLGGYCARLAWANSAAEAGGGAAVLLYLLCLGVWYAACAAAHLTGDTLRRDRWLSRVLLAVFAVLSLAASPLLLDRFAAACRWCRSIPEGGFSWWQVIAATAALAGCAIAACDFPGRRPGADCLVLGGLAGLLLLLRTLVSCYSPVGLAAPVVYLAGLLRCVRNEGAGRRTLSLSSLTYLAAQTGALILALWLLSRGLWPVAAALAVYALVFHALGDKTARPHPLLLDWLLRLSLPAVLAMGYLWRLGFHPGSLLFLAAACGVLALVMVVLQWSNPAGRTGPAGLNWSLCGLMALLSLSVCLRFGADVRLVHIPNDPTVQVEVAARGRDNEVRSAVYCWYDWTGNPLGREQSLGSGVTEMGVAGDRLEITVEDSRGVRTRATGWYLFDIFP